MDKKNYTLTRREKQVMKAIIAQAKGNLIRALEEAQLIQRKRKLQSCELLLSALYHYLVEGLSFRRLSSYMDCKYQIRLSSTAWKKQFYKAIPVLREAVIHFAEEAIQPVSTQTTYALDATAFSAQGRPTTIARVHSSVSLADGICHYDKVTDEHVAESVKNFPIQPGALYLADKAYAKSSQLAYLLEQKADFLIRFSPAHIKLYKDAKGKKRLDVDSLLDAENFSKVCYICHCAKIYPVRIVGMLLPETVHDNVQKKYVTRPERIKPTFAPALWNTPNG